MKAEKVHKNSTTFYNVKDFYVDFNIGYASILLENLFNGDKDLGKLIREIYILQDVFLFTLFRLKVWWDIEGDR